MLVPWTIRNYRALGGIVPTRSNFGMNFWMGNNPESSRQVEYLGPHSETVLGQPVHLQCRTR